VGRGRRPEGVGGKGRGVDLERRGGVQKKVGRGGRGRAKVRGNGRAGNEGGENQGKGGSGEEG